MSLRRPRAVLRTIVLAGSALLAAECQSPTGGVAFGAERAAPAKAQLRELSVPGFLPAVLFVPGGTESRPLVVAAHGAGGAPEWECEYWRRLLEERSFVLCLRGSSMGKAGGFYYENEHALEAELVAAERAVRESEPRIASAPGVYAGFSQGASFASAIIAKHGAAFSRLALIEGFERWNIARARAFAKAGGQRILFACGTKACNAAATESARWLNRSGVEARVELAPGAGHTPLGPVMQRVQESLPWLLGPAHGALNRRSPRSREVEGSRR